MPCKGMAVVGPGRHRRCGQPGRLTADGGDPHLSEHAALRRSRREYLTGRQVPDEVWDQGSAVGVVMAPGGRLLLALTFTI
jgi:hypothetical protein